MDFNDIEKAWKNDKTPEVTLPSNLDKIASAHMPLDKIRKNLKYELIAQVVSIVIIGLLPFIYGLSEELLISFYLLFFPFAINCYYFLSKLYTFFKRISKQELNTKDHLYETYYDIMLNIQLYKSFNYSLIPFVIVMVGVFFLNEMDKESLMLLVSPEKIKGTLGFVTGFFMGLTGSIGGITELWINAFYGKYAKEIRKVLDELKE